MLFSFDMCNSLRGERSGTKGDKATPLYWERQGGVRSTKSISLPQQGIYVLFVLLCKGCIIVIRGDTVSFRGDTVTGVGCQAVTLIYHLIYQ